jgi:hypothetical protein
MNDEEGSAFFGEGCFENVRAPSGKEKEDWRDFSKVECQVLLSKAGMALTAIGEITQ